MKSKKTTPTRSDAMPSSQSKQVSYGLGTKHQQEIKEVEIKKLWVECHQNKRELKALHKRWLQLAAANKSYKDPTKDDQWTLLVSELNPRY